MTVEKKTLISLRDILAIEYACPNCQTAYTIPLGKFDQAVNRCPNCGKGVIATDGMAPDDEAVRTFVLLLRELAARQIGKVLRLEISNIIP